MKHLQVPFIKSINSQTPLQKISAVLDSEEQHFINIAPWPDYSYLPKVSFAVIHSNTAICLKYFVDESYVQAHYHQVNDPVYNDSCVEFFIGFDDVGRYYNLEFNCLGTALVGYGKSNDRDYLEKDIIENVSRYTSLQPGFKEGALQWQLTLMIPVTVFCFDKISTLQGSKARANFFKCGDQLPQKHYCAWNKVHSSKCNFHLPEYFGSMEFL